MSKVAATVRCDAWCVDTARADGVAVISAHTHECVRVGLDHADSHRCACGRTWIDAEAARR